GREYVPGQVHRSDRMAATGLDEDGKRGIRRLTDPELRLKDQERDGVQAEVLYGILGATRRLNDAEAAVELVRIYNEWLAGFCDEHLDRYAGLACIPNFPVEAAVEELRRVIKRGGVRGIGWIPYVLDRMDAEWEDQFKDLSLTMRPSEYWRRQCRATYQTDRIGIKLLDDVGHDTIMWGSDFPHPDGVWPDSSEFIERELRHL